MEIGVVRLKKSETDAKNQEISDQKTEPKMCCGWEIVDRGRRWQF